MKASRIRLEKRILEGILIAYFKYLWVDTWRRIDGPEGNLFSCSNLPLSVLFDKEFSCKGIFTGGIVLITRGGLISGAGLQTMSVLLLLFLCLKVYWSQQCLLFHVSSAVAFVLNDKDE